MSKSKEHWMTAMILVLLAGTPSSYAWLQWVLIAGGAIELALAVITWPLWPWRKKSTG